MRWSLAVLFGWAGCSDGGPAGEAACEAPFPAWLDADGDGYGAEAAGDVCALAAGQADRPGDCDDADGDVHPGAEEACDGIDNDCIEGPDQGLPGARVVYTDTDGDGFGVRYPATFRCGPLGDGWSEVADDCDDDDRAVHPDAREVCDDRDNDCDGLVDALDSDIDQSTYQTFYADVDRDGFGASSPTIEACSLPFGYADNADDCAANDPDRFPGSSEVCNGLDDDCDNLTDDADPSLDTTTQTDFYVDADDDGWGIPGSVVRSCRDGAGRADNDLDCDDTRPDLNLDDVDVDGYATCDGDCNDANALISPADLDGDGFAACDPTPDCAPTNGGVYPGAPELTADGVDQDCDGRDACFQDLDHDSYGSPTVIVGQGLGCDRLGESTVSTDCDDADPRYAEVHPWYADADGDGSGDGAEVGRGCYPPYEGASPTGDDCDATDPAIWPGAPETCEDAIDQDCDGADEACCSLDDVIADAGWPAVIQFNYCWGFVTPCPFPPNAAQYTLAADGTYTLPGYTGVWVVDEELCELSLTFDQYPYTVYRGQETTPGCIAGTMAAPTASGTWAGCLR